MKKLIFLSISVFLISCSNTKKVISDNSKGNTKMNYLKFRFGDSSVAPEYHRSFELTFKNNSVKIVVNSYGDILTDETIKLKSDKVNEAFSLIEKHNISKKATANESHGCTGGTSYYVTYGIDDKATFDASTYKCGRSFYGNLTGDVTGLENDLKALIPNFSNYLKQ